MKIGLVSAILGDYTYKDMIDIVSKMGFRCVEVACWPKGKAERRYAGVSHIDVERVLQDDTYCEDILQYAKERNVEISSLAFYPNTLDGNLEARAAHVAHLKNVIRASAKLKVNLVTTFIGRDQTKTGLADVGRRDAQARRAGVVHRVACEDRLPLPESARGRIRYDGVPHRVVQGARAARVLRDVLLHPRQGIRRRRVLQGCRRAAPPHPRDRKQQGCDRRGTGLDDDA